MFSTEGGLLAMCLLAMTFSWRLVQQNSVVARLRRQHQRVAELEEMKSAYLRLASHELRTPIGVARGYVDLAQSGELGTLPQPAREALEQVGASLRDADAILTEMVEIARMQEGRRLLRVDKLDLRETVREAYQRVAPLTTSHHLLISQPESPLWIEGDRLRLRSAVRNLLENAIKYSPEGGEIRCTLNEVGGMASVTVSDRGLGIPPSQVEKLFQRFERASQAAPGGIPGTGLGLHLAREIARAHEGDLTVSSHRDLGTTFVLSLPLSGGPSARNGRL
ncbi:MAG: HAMP domain-containing histidine kinase [Candidatus Dormibacteraeota bacterium]|jgi:signal transduction histidine kinase|nr:HAMP domain-containing histidine kinase [Candidatus Dormibacteraeota bacterium]